MIRLWVAAGVLVALLLGALWNTQRLETDAQQIIALLEQAQAASEEGNNESALALTKKAQAYWEVRSPGFFAILDHQPVDEVSLCFCDALEYLADRETGGEYSAANQRLILSIRLLVEMERMSLQNFL